MTRPVSSTPVIDCHGLTHRYGRKEVLHDVTFAVEPGRIFGLLGKNGAGKTTTINVLMGFLQPTGGRCTIFGEPSHDIAPLTRRRIGLLHEGHLQYDFLTVAQVERFYASFYPRWDRAVFYELVDLLSVPPGRRLSRMSCGQRSQVALGLILAQDADLMLLDDYSMGLDAGYRRLFLDYLQEHVRDTDKTVLVTTHIVQDLERLVDEILILDAGRVLVQSSLQAFQDGLRCLVFRAPDARERLGKDDVIRSFDVVGDTVSVYAFADRRRVEARLVERGLVPEQLREAPMTLEDAFIGITGKY